MFSALDYEDSPHIHIFSPLVLLSRRRLNCPSRNHSRIVYLRQRIKWSVGQLRRGQ